MNPYRTSSPRKIFAIAAVAMTAITIGFSVVVPTQIQSGARDARTLTASKAMTPAPAEVVVGPLRVEVIGVRDPKLISVQVRGAPPKRKQES
jgi:hypothetical protein